MSDLPFEWFNHICPNNGHFAVSVKCHKANEVLRERWDAAGAVGRQGAWGPPLACYLRLKAWPIVEPILGPLGRPSFLAGHWREAFADPAAPCPFVEWGGQCGERSYQWNGPDGKGQPPWICQACYRPAPPESVAKLDAMYRVPGPPV